MKEFMGKKRKVRLVVKDLMIAKALREGRDPKDFYPHEIEEDKAVSKVADEFMLDQKNEIKEILRRELEVGRYPPGWRHYENFEVYARHFKNRTIEDYHLDMNRQVTFTEFFSISKAFYLDQKNDPAFVVDWQ